MLLIVERYYIAFYRGILAISKKTNSKEFHAPIFTRKL